MFKYTLTSKDFGNSLIQSHQYASPSQVCVLTIEKKKEKEDDLKCLDTPQFQKILVIH